MEIPPRMLLCVILASAFAGGWIEKSMTKTDTLKDTVQEKTETKNNVVTIIKEKANGEKETTIVDHSKSTELTQSELVLTHNEVAKDWLIVGGMSVDRSTYLLGLDRRILGPVYLGVWSELGTNKLEYGLNIAIQF